MDRGDALTLKSQLADAIFPAPELPFERFLPSRARTGGRTFGREMSQQLPGLGRVVRRAAGSRVATPTLALGVSVDCEGDHRLAVRIQSAGPQTERKLAQIRQATDALDVQSIGRVVKRAGTGPWQRDRHRPLRIGSSVGHPSVTAGTLGCFVRRRDGALRMLSNNHVLAAENAGRVGDAVLQPAGLDAGRAPEDVVGELSSFVELHTTEANRVDCALAELRDGVDADLRTLDNGVLLEGVAAEEDAIAVEKVGRSTGRTRGVVTTIDIDNLVVEYDIGELRFDGAIQIESEDRRSFSDGGDSGALIYTADTHLALGLLFAGTQAGGAHNAGRTFAHPIDAVLSALDVRLVR